MYFILLLVIWLSGYVSELDYKSGHSCLSLVSVSEVYY